MHASLCTLCSNACTYHTRRAKIIFSLHWTHLINFYFLHHPQILYFLIAIANEEMCMHVYAYFACMHAHITPNFFWCIVDTSLIVIPSFIEIRCHLIEIKWFVYCPKCMHIYMLCACMLMHTNIINQLRRPILKYAENFMIFWLNLAEL